MKGLEHVVGVNCLGSVEQALELHRQGSPVSTVAVH